ncbi:hypothetical protein AB0L04_33510 [Streptomyces glaucescens]
MSTPSPRSTKDDTRVSVRLIDGDDNETGGRRRLNDMYTINRMLDGDAST